MGIAYNTSVVKSGLVISLDAGNVKSYSGSGTAWKNMIDKADSTLYDTPTYNADRDTFTFNGTTQYVDVPCPALVGKSTITVEGVMKWVSLNGGMFFGFSSYDVFTHQGRLGYNNAASNVIGISAADVTALGLVGTFKHYAFVMNAGALMTTNKIYIDGVSQPVTVQYNADGTGPAFSNTMKLCGWNNATNYRCNMEYGAVRIYDRGLTAAEVNQNYQATRGRYGI